MQQVTSLPRHCGSRSMGIRNILVILLLLAWFILNDASAAVAASQTPPEITWQKLEKLLAQRTFTSQEELFQLLYILYSEEKYTAFRLERETIARLDENIKTLFPLDECQTIEFSNSRATFTFAGPQDVAIPNTWRQASLAIAEKLVLRLDDVPLTHPEGMGQASPAEKQDSENRSIRFSVEQGSLQLHFSFLLKIFGGRMRDAEGSELVYRINAREKTSRLHLVELTPLAQNSLKVVKGQADPKMPDTLWIDIIHPDFPAVQDIGISAKKVAFLGTRVELLADQMIRIGDGEAMKNPEAWNWFTTNIGMFRQFAKTGTLASRIDYSRNFGYHFEERRIVMNMGFQGGENGH